jgi:hypothetical protein
MEGLLLLLLIQAPSLEISANRILFSRCVSILLFITSSHDNKKFRIRSVEEQGGMAFGFRKTATAVIKPEW